MQWPPMNNGDFIELHELRRSFWRFSFLVIHCNLRNALFALCVPWRWARNWLHQDKIAWSFGSIPKSNSLRVTFFPVSLPMYWLTAFHVIFLNDYKWTIMPRNRSLIISRFCSGTTLILQILKCLMRDAPCVRGTHTFQYTKEWRCLLMNPEHKSNDCAVVSLATYTGKVVTATTPETFTLTGTYYVLHILLQQTNPHLWTQYRLLRNSRNSTTLRFRVVFVFWNDLSSHSACLSFLSSKKLNSFIAVIFPFVRNCVTTHGPAKDPAGARDVFTLSPRRHLSFRFSFR